MPHPGARRAAGCGRARAGAARRRRDRSRPSSAAPVFSSPGERRSISPAMIAQCRKVRFISADSSSQASRSSPSMSSSNRSREREPAGADGAGRDRRGPRPPAHSRWRRSRAAAAVRAPAGGSAACRASGGRAGPRTGSRRGSCLPPRGNVSTSSSPGCGSARAPLLDAEPVAHLVRQRRPRSGSDMHVAHPRGQIGRERELAARVGGHLGRRRHGARDT